MPLLAIVAFQGDRLAPALVVAADHQHQRVAAGLRCEIIPLQACCPAPSRMPIPGDNDPGLWHVRNRRDIQQPPSRQPRSKDRFLEAGR
jgi:hypothetical protein